MMREGRGSSGVDYTDTKDGKSGPTIKKFV